MSEFESETELPRMDIEVLRRQNIADNQRVLKEIMADLQKLMPPKLQSRPKLQKPRMKKPRDPACEPVRRNPSRSARVSLLELSPPRTRSRSSSISSSSSTLSSPNKMVVKFGFFGRDGTGEDTAADSDLEEDYMPKRARVSAVRDERSADEITEDDLKLVAETVRDKSYDSIYGSSCHQCRQKTNDMKTICRSGFCYGVRGQFCGPCLRNRYGENAKEALKNSEWQCPPCRNICNCSFCRKKQGKSCTGILIHLAREIGYSNVNDYLQSLKMKYANDD